MTQDEKLNNLESRPQYCTDHWPDVRTMKTMCEMCNSQQNVKDLESRLSAKQAELEIAQEENRQHWIAANEENDRHIARITELESLVSAKEKELQRITERHTRQVETIGKHQEEWHKQQARIRQLEQACRRFEPLCAWMERCLPTDSMGHSIAKQVRPILQKALATETENTE